MKTNCGSCYDGHVQCHVYFLSYLQIAHLEVFYIRMKGELGFYIYTNIESMQGIKKRLPTYSINGII
jgi:hypothetical protein